MGLFDKIGSARASRESNYIKPGRYLVLIERVKQDANRSAIPFVAIEMRVIKTIAVESKTSETPPLWGFVDATSFDPKTMKAGDTAPHTEGEYVSHLIMANNEMFLPNFKAFIRDVVGMPEADITPQNCEELVSDIQPLAGRVVELRAKTIITKAKGKEFTRVSYGNAMTLEAFYAEVGEDFPLPEGALWVEEGVEQTAATHGEDAPKA